MTTPNADAERCAGRSTPSDPVDWVRVARAATVLATVTASVCLFVLQVRNPDALQAFIVSNVLPRADRWVAVLSIPALACSVVLFSALWVWRSGAKAAASLRMAARLTAPGVLAFAVPALFLQGPWERNQLGFLCLAGAFGLTAERLLRVSLSAVPSALTERLSGLSSRAPPVVVRWGPTAVVAVGVMVYLCTISHGALVNHWRMVTSSSDLAEFDNLFFNALHGHPFRAPAIDGDLRDWSALKTHAEFGLYLLLPLYALRPGPETLVVIQTALVAVTAVPIYLFAQRRLPRPLAVVVALVYLLLPAVQRPNFYDFHFLPLGMFFVAWTLFFLDGRPGSASVSTKRHPRWNVVMLAAAYALALGSREDMAVGLAVAGAFVFLSGHRPRAGVVLLVVSAAYFLLVKFALMPSFGATRFDRFYEALKVPGEDGHGSVIKTVVTNPTYLFGTLLTEEKLVFLLHMLVPLLCLWVRRPVLAVAALPGSAFTLLTTGYAPTTAISYQYSYHWIPYIVAASVLGLQWLGRGQDGRLKQLCAACALGVVALAANHQYGALLGGERIIGGPRRIRLSMTPQDLRRLEQLRSLTRMIPPQASVAATEHEGPHVSTRLVMYSLKYTFGEAPDYLLVGRVRLRRENRHVVHALTSGKYGVVARRGGFTLIQRGANPAENKLLLRMLKR